MSWVTDDGLHEGYAAYITKDGRVIGSTSADGLHTEVGHYTEAGEWDRGEILPMTELLGWEARCDCYPADLPDAEYVTVRPPRTTVGPMWRRSSVLASQPGAAAPEHPEDAFAADGSGTVEEAVLRWWHEHVEASRSRLGV